MTGRIANCKRLLEMCAKQELVVGTLQTHDSWAESYRMLISTCSNDLPMDSARRVLSNDVLPDVRFLNKKFGSTKYNGNVVPHPTFEL